MKQNPYSAPSTVGDDAMHRFAAQSYVWTFALASIVGIFSSAAYVMGPKRFLQDIVNSPGEFGIVAGMTLCVGFVVGWLTRDRRPAARPLVPRFLRFLAGFLMGFSPKYWQDSLDWLLLSNGVTITAQLSFYRFLATIVLAILSAALLELVLRAFLVQRPPVAPTDSPTKGTDLDRPSESEIR